MLHDVAAAVNDTAVRRLADNLPNNLAKGLANNLDNNLV